MRFSLYRSCNASSGARIHRGCPLAVCLRREPSSAKGDIPLLDRRGDSPSVRFLGVRRTNEERPLWFVKGGQPLLFQMEKVAPFPGASWSSKNMHFSAFRMRLPRSRFSIGRKVHDFGNPSEPAAHAQGAKGECPLSRPCLSDLLAWLQVRSPGATCSPPLSLRLL